ncbi:ras-specific guanine nucleotide-releasing factor RalGPS1-like [Lethenteron reissneri]|uniref:ras-specific guanine nucleotide-releasing factor RalGPS1-like n=1 Tax=Lethenteron reissneri TaxID=7753 RepID=UPI002AB74066|nr:ras-specific guanine nucleotide-releasing factor RalGPS1-like [Lethenteron reissneri]
MDMAVGNRSHNASSCAQAPESTSSTESMSEKPSAASQMSKSYDAVVFDVLKVTPEEFASQITLMDCPVFKAIQPEELSSCGWNRKEKHSLAPNVVAFTRRFNHVSFWVVREILKARTLKIRAEILCHFIKIAKKLHELKNLHALIAVLSALQSAPIFRLAKTWGLLSRKDKASFDKLDYLMSKEDNYKRIREYVHSIRMMPCIPYLGIYLSDLIYIDSAYPASDSIMENEQRSIQMNNILRVISDFQQSCHYGNRFSPGASEPSRRRAPDGFPPAICRADPLLNTSCLCVPCSSPATPLSGVTSPAAGAVTIEGALKRKTLLKDGRKPALSSWTRFWVALSGSLLIYYPSKALKATERKHFKSVPCKVVSVLGWMSVLPDLPEHPDVFQLTDSERGNSYKFQAGTRLNAHLWHRHLDSSCKSNRPQVPANLMSFE